MKFHVRGEVAATLKQHGNEPRLLVDISPEVARDSHAPGFRYPKRVCFTLRNPRLISRFNRRVSIGDVIEAHGIFNQSGYIPQGNGHVDTTFEMLSFAQQSFDLPELSYAGRTYSLDRPAALN